MNSEPELLKMLNETIREILLELKNGLPIAEVNLKEFVEKFEEVYPDETMQVERVRAEALIWALMGEVLLLYSLNMNSAVISELHSILERLALRETIQAISKPSKNYILEKLIGRSTLSDVSPILLDLGILDKEDVSFARNLTKLRNGIAHKNPRIISDALLSGKRISYLDINSSIAKVDCIPIILGGVRFLLKLSAAKTS